MLSDVDKLPEKLMVAFSMPLKSATELSISVFPAKVNSERFGQRAKFNPPCM